MRVYRPQYTRNGKTHRSKTWRLEFRHHGRLRNLSTGTTSRRVAEDMGRRIDALIESASLELGMTRRVLEHMRTLPTPVTDKLIEWGVVPREHAATVSPLGEFFKAFGQAIVHQGGGEGHASQTVTRAATLARAARIDTYQDLCAPGVSERVLAALAGLGEGDDAIADRTAAHHLAALRQFCRWMHERKRMGESPVATLRRSGRIKEVHARRSISLGEFERFLQAASSDDQVGGMTGPEWAIVYWLCAVTGMDRGTVKQLTPQHIRFVGDAAVITARRPKTEVILTPWITDEALVAALRDRVATIMPTAPLFRLPKHTARIVRRHLEMAGVVYRDGAGRVFDFHAIRKQFSTVGQDAGISARSIQQALGHADIKTTLGHYTDATEASMRKLADAMPRLRLDRPAMKRLP